MHNESSRSAPVLLQGDPNLTMSEGQLKIDEDGLYEVVDGDLIGKANVGLLAGATISIMTTLLSNFVIRNRAGIVVTDVSFRCFPNKPNQVRRPNIAFIHTDRAAQIPAEGHVQVIPDLAIEVVLPGDLVYELDGKLMDYRRSKFPLAWVVNPRSRTVQVYHYGKQKIRLQSSDDLTGEEILPGFSVKVGELFPADVSVNA